MSAELAMLMFSAGHTREDIESFISEIEMMKKVSVGNHPHIVKMVGCDTSSSPLKLLLEYVPHGNLREYLRKNRSSVSILYDVMTNVDMRVCTQVRVCVCNEYTFGKMSSFSNFITQVCLVKYHVYVSLNSH